MINALSSGHRSQLEDGVLGITAGKSLWTIVKVRVTTANHLEQHTSTCMELVLGPFDAKSKKTP